MSIAKSLSEIVPGTDVEIIKVEGDMEFTCQMVAIAFFPGAHVHVHRRISVADVLIVEADTVCYAIATKIGNLIKVREI